MTKLVWSVPRNDLAAARRFYAQRGHVTGEELHALLMLQDDPAELRELARDWVVVNNQAAAVDANDAFMARLLTNREK